MAIVNKIIHSSVVDGPGNRAAVFLQKCNFKCSYCHNPETIGQCVQCGACVEKCPAKALSLKDGKIVWDEDNVVNVILVSMYVLICLRHE